MQRDRSGFGLSVTECNNTPTTCASSTETEDSPTAETSSCIGDFPEDHTKSETGGSVHYQVGKCEESAAALRDVGVGLADGLIGIARYLHVTI